VEEALVIAAEGVAYLKVDMDHLDMERLNAYSVASTEQSEELTG
jgi:hypothetical protein